MPSGWMLLTYSLPSEPSAPRVATWRRLKKMGALYHGTGIWLLPHTEELAVALADVAEDVRRFGGAALSFFATDMSPAQASTLRDLFNAERGAEYEDLANEAGKLYSHLLHEVETKHFVFTEVEEHEEDVEKLTRRFEQVQQRDIFGAEGRLAVQQRLRQCTEALETFLKQTYEHMDDHSRS